MTTIEVTEAERQMLLKALGTLAAENPGWDHFLNEIACKMDNVSPETGRAEMFEGFRKGRAVQNPLSIWDRLSGPGWGGYDWG